GCHARTARGSDCAAPIAGANAVSRLSVRARAASPRVRESSVRTIVAAQAIAAATSAAPARPNICASVLEHRVHALVRELGAAVQRHELDQKREAVHRAAQPLDEIRRRAGRAAGGEQVVDDEHALAAAHGVGVHLEGIAAVLEVVGRAHRGRRQLARLAHGRKPGADAIRNGGAEDEAAALDADNELDALIAERQHQRVDRKAKSLAILEERRDVVEEDAGFRKIGNVANLRFQLVHVSIHLTLKPVSRPVGIVSSTSTSSTRAPGGPWRTACSKRSIASASPSASASTRPSGRLRTQPWSPSRRPVSYAK